MAFTTGHKLGMGLVQGGVGGAGGDGGEGALALGGGGICMTTWQREVC